MKKHIAILNKSTIEAILSGVKTIEARFSNKRICPFGEVGVGDIVYMKLSGGEIEGQFRVKKVFYFEGLMENDLEEIFFKYGLQIGMKVGLEGEKYKSEKKVGSFGMLIFISESERFITSPIKVQKRDNRSWRVLD